MKRHVIYMLMFLMILASSCQSKTKTMNYYTVANLNQSNAPLDMHYLLSNKVDSIHVSKIDSLTRYVTNNNMNFDSVHLHRLNKNLYSIHVEIGRRDIEIYVVDEHVPLLIIDGGTTLHGGQIYILRNSAYSTEIRNLLKDERFILNKINSQDIPYEAHYKLVDRFHGLCMS